MRSLLAVLALMVASAAGGFLYSEFLKQRNAEDLRAMRDELKDLRTLLAYGRDQAGREQLHATDAAGAQPTAALMPIAMEGVEDAVESIAYVPACRRTDAADGLRAKQTLSALLCAAPYRPTPASSGSSCSRSPTPSSIPGKRIRPRSSRTSGGARFTGKSFEYAQANELKAVCVNFMQWSSEHPHIARILVQYGFGDAPKAAETPTGTPAAGRQVRQSRAGGDRGRQLALHPERRLSRRARQHSLSSG